MNVISYPANARFSCGGAGERHKSVNAFSALCPPSAASGCWGAPRMGLMAPTTELRTRFLLDQGLAMPPRDNREQSARREAGCSMAMIWILKRPDKPRDLRIRSSLVVGSTFLRERIYALTSQPNAPAELRALSEKQASRQLQPVVRRY